MLIVGVHNQYKNSYTVRGVKMVQCWQCENMFEPDKEAVKNWAQSGKAFEPTDWECEDCRRANDPAFNESLYPTAEYWEDEEAV